jgi:hypothetical protein
MMGKKSFFKIIVLKLKDLYIQIKAQIKVQNKNIVLVNILNKVNQ